MWWNLLVQGLLFRKRNAFLDLDFDAQQRRFERDIVRRNADDSEKFRYLLSKL